MAKTNLDLLTDFICSTSQAELAPDVLDAAKQCLVDWFAVSIAATSDPAAVIVRGQMQQWATAGKAISLYGDSGAAGPMALVNGTLAHSLDFDDLHLGSAYHASGPTLAVALAVGMDRGCSELDILKAFVIGFEVGTTMGDEIGLRLAGGGWHPTGTLGHFSATATAAVLLKLTPEQTAHALGLAATQCAGLQASGGSMAKPFHVGKAAMNGIMSAELAIKGMEATITLFDQERTGILGCLLQEAILPRFDSLGKTWQILKNSFKPYAACQLTHSAFEVGKRAAAGFERKGLEKISVYVNPLAPKVASRPKAGTPMEGKFSIPYCTALGLKGYSAGQEDFTDARIDEIDLAELSDMVDVVSDESVERWGARLDLFYSDGTVRTTTLDVVSGGPGRPLLWPDLDKKFLDSGSPVLGHRTKAMLRCLKKFDKVGQLAEMTKILLAIKPGFRSIF